MFQPFGLTILLAVLLPLGVPVAAFAADPLPVKPLAQLGTARYPNIGRLMALAFSPEGKTLAAGSWDGGIWLWDVASRKEIRQLAGHDGLVKSLAFSSDGRRLISAGEDGSVRLWDIAGGREIRRFLEPSQQNHAHSLAWLSPDGKTLAYWLSFPWREQAIHFLDLDSGQPLGKLTMEAPPTPKGFWKDGTQFGAVQLLQPIRLNQTSTLRLWDWRTSNELPSQTVPFWLHDNGVLSPDGRMVSRGSGAITVWETATWQERCNFRSPVSGPCAVAISADGRYLASGGRDVAIFLWDLTGLNHPDSPPVEARAADLPALWRELDRPDAQRAYRALWQMVAAGQPSVAYVRERVRPVQPPSPETVAGLLTKLDDPKFVVRDQAARELTALRELAIPFLRDKLAVRSPTLESRRRLERLLETATSLTPDRIRELRAIEMLERLDTPEAREALQTLAKGAPAARLTQEAKAALERLARNHSPG